ncbi:MAG TPA: hypothetical protein VGF84_10045 [Micromonosporaceae bacterium]
MPRQILKAGVIVLAALAVVGCSPKNSSSAPSGTHTTGTHTTGTKVAAAGAGTDVNACSLVTVAQATAATGKHYSGATPTTPSPGADMCTYKNSDDGSDLVITVYQPNSGVTYKALIGVLSGVGSVKDVSSDVGTTATVGAIELDAQAPGNRAVAIEGAGGIVPGQWSAAITLAKAIIAGLH